MPIIAGSKVLASSRHDYAREPSMSRCIQYMREIHYYIFPRNAFLTR